LTGAVDTLASLAWSDVHVACDEDRKAKLDNDVPHLALNYVATGEKRATSIPTHGCAPRTPLARDVDWS
jgi:hypothetical protein